MRVFCGLLCAVPVGLLFEAQWGECKRVVCVSGGGGGLLGDIFKLKYPFCDINRVGCPRLTQPGCRIGGITADSACLGSLCLGANYHWKFVGGPYYGCCWDVFGLS